MNTATHQCWHWGLILDGKSSDTEGDIRCDGGCCKHNLSTTCQSFIESVHRYPGRRYCRVLDFSSVFCKWPQSKQSPWRTSFPYNYIALLHDSRRVFIYRSRGRHLGSAPQEGDIKQATQIWNCLSHVLFIHHATCDAGWPRIHVKCNHHWRCGGGWPFSPELCYIISSHLSFNATSYYLSLLAV